jgi:poly-beta-1,6-N-acetyl-D-glucosamine synthase
VTAVFWLSVIAIAWVYFGYPAIVGYWARLRPRPVRRLEDGAALPAVSIVIAARDEAERLPAKIENLLQLDYPASLRQIIVVSDGSTDGTIERLERYRHHIDIVELPRSGKAAALNAGVARARHEILVFSDARQPFARDALLALVANFADPEVGAVSGELILDCEDGALDEGASTIGDGVGLYWRFEKWLRLQESTIWSMLGATGAIYALRRSLWQPLPPQTLLDDVLVPMRAVLAGKRAVFEPRARAYDSTAPDASVESKRKTRTIAGNYQILWLEPRLLIPFVNPVWLQYLSHKVGGRLLVPYALIALFVSSAALAPTGVLYFAAFAGQVLLYLLAGYGAVLDARARRQRSAPDADTASVERVHPASSLWTERRHRGSRVPDG